MRNFLLNIMQWVLTKFARLTILRFRPGIIGITGSAGKTSTKLAIAAVLSGYRSLRHSPGGSYHFNTELGLLLTILGEWPKKKLQLLNRDHPEGKYASKAFFMLQVMAKSFANLLFPRRVNYPELLVLEYGIDRPGDMKRLLKIARPDIGVVTAIGEVPAHVEFFKSPRDVVREKARLVDQLPATSFAVLNADDAVVSSLAARSRAHAMTYGFSKNAHVRLSALEYRVEDGAPQGISFKIEYAGNMVPVRIDGVLSKTHAYAAAAGAAIGLIFGVNLVTISENLKNYRPAAGRMQIVQGVEGALVLDDSYNASPASMEAAIATLDEVPGKRKIAILGDMLEVEPHTIEVHEKAGRAVSDVADILVAVGKRAKFIAESARASGMNRKSIMSFETADEAARMLPSLVRKGDIVLVKGAHALHMGQIVEDISASPKASL